MPDARPQDVTPAAPLLPWVVGLAGAYAFAELVSQFLVWTSAPPWLAVLATVVYVATIVVSLVWLHRIARNASLLGGAKRTWSPGWAVGAWFIPLANWFLPFLVVKELWQVSSPDRVDGRQQATPALLIIWWLLWVGSRAVGLVFGILGGVQAAIEALDGASPEVAVEAGSYLHVGALLSAGLLAAALVPWVMVTRGLQERQDGRQARMLQGDDGLDWTPIV